MSVISKASRAARRLRARRREERGAFAVLYALMVVMLLSIAALSTDLGNAFWRKTGTQTQADFAALQAASDLGQYATGTGTVSQTILDSVAASMNSNQPPDDSRSCWRNTPVDCVSAAQLADGDLSNGEVRYTSLGLQVISPQARVNFGFANVFGSSGAWVNSAATVNVFTAGPRVLPMFAVAGCDYGRQTLTDPANGQVPSSVPPLADNNDTNNNNLTGLALQTSAGAVVDHLDVGSTGNYVFVSASKWKNLGEIGFFRDDSTDPATIQHQGTFWLSSDANQTPLVAPYTQNNGSQLALRIPDAVAANAGVWYVRAWDQTTSQWSDSSEALPIRVGQVLFECAGGSTDGNFGTLKLPRATGSTADWLPLNIAMGLEDPLNLVVHHYAIDNNTNGLCSDGVNGAVVSSINNIQPNTNCVGTDTGLAANVATSGLVTVNAPDGKRGLLTRKATTCPGRSDRQVNVQNHQYSLNNDVLSCFLTSADTLATIESPSYSGGPLLSNDIFSSPRFAWVPVLAVQPTTGSSDDYSIIDFRPAFITDETPAATAGVSDASQDNGLTFSNNGITQLKVVFFNRHALPGAADGDPLIPFLGIGDPNIHLVD